jgi:hypothetical protein
MRPNSYDRKQMRRVKAELVQAHAHATWALEDDRSLADRQVRAAFVQMHAEQASVLAGRLEKRLAKARS